MSNPTESSSDLWRGFYYYGMGGGAGGITGLQVQVLGKCCVCPASALLWMLLLWSVGFRISLLLLYIVV